MCGSSWSTPFLKNEDSVAGFQCHLAQYRLPFGVFGDAVIICRVEAPLPSVSVSNERVVMQCDWSFRRRFHVFVAVLVILSALFSSSQIGADNGTGAANKSKTDERNGKPESASAAVQTVIDGLKKGEAVVLWEFLPTSYQKDVNDIIREFARHEDAEVWNRDVATAQRILKIVRTRKAFVFDAFRDSFVEPAMRMQTEADWDAMFRCLEAIVNSDFSDIEKLRAFDGRAFFAGNVTNALKQFLGGTQNEATKKFVDSLSMISVKQVNAGADVVLVRITLPADAKGRKGKVIERHFVKREGQWIPKEMAEGWKTNIVNLKWLLKLGPLALQLNPLTSGVADNKERVLKLYDLIDQGLAEMETAKTQDEFDAALMQTMPLAGVQLQRQFLVACVFNLFSWLEIDEPPKDGSPTNQQLAETVASRLTKSRLRGFDIAIRVKNGQATFTGTVSTAEEKEWVTAIASKVHGINAVKNELMVIAVERANRD